MKEKLYKINWVEILKESKKHPASLPPHDLHFLLKEFSKNPARETFFLPLKDAEKLNSLLKRAFDGEPLAYILGSIPFYHLNLAITPDVLIPRPETEYLIEIILKKEKHLITSPFTGWDLCTGSGCIGLALKKAFSQSTWCLSDISEEALLLAKKNSSLNKIEVSFLKGDLFTPFKGRKADLITANPPYLSSNEGSPSLLFEPSLALFAKNEGLAFYERFAKESANYLNPKGVLWLEMGGTQSDMVLKLFDNAGWQKEHLEIYADQYKVPRFLRAIKT